MQFFSQISCALNLRNIFYFNFPVRTQKLFSMLNVCKRKQPIWRLFLYFVHAKRIKKTDTIANFHRSMCHSRIFLVRIFFFCLSSHFFGISFYTRCFNIKFLSTGFRHSSCDIEWNWYVAWSWCLSINVKHKLILDWHSLALQRMRRVYVQTLKRYIHTIVSNCKRPNKSLSCVCLIRLHCTFAVILCGAKIKIIRLNLIAHFF